jgi:hypothetical protein
MTPAASRSRQRERNDQVKRNFLYSSQFRKMVVIESAQLSIFPQFTPQVITALVHLYTKAEFSLVCG